MRSSSSDATPSNNGPNPTRRRLDYWESWKELAFLGLQPCLPLSGTLRAWSLTRVTMRKGFPADYALEGAAKSCYWPARLNEAYVSFGETVYPLRTLTKLRAATSIRN